MRVTWNDAMRFCAWLSKTCNVKATLPTEAQWEWAARAGTDTPFPWGGRDDDYTKFANFADRDVRFQVVGFDGGGNIRKRKPFAIWQNYPLHEERWEDDWFNLNYVGRANCNRVARGGSFASRPRDGTSSFRLAYEPWQAVYDVGFRVVLEEE